MGFRIWGVGFTVQGRRVQDLMLKVCTRGMWGKEKERQTFKLPFRGSCLGFRANSKHHPTPDIQSVPKIQGLLLGET